MMNVRLRLLLFASFLLILASTRSALAVERWGKVKSVDTRFHKFVVVQEGSEKQYEIRVNADTCYVLRDGRSAADLAITSLRGQRVYAIVEENPGHYASKIWMRPNVPAEEDPVNPGVGAVLDAETISKRLNAGR